MEKLERLAGRLARNCNKLASLDGRLEEEILAAASAVGELADEYLSLSGDEPLPMSCRRAVQRQPVDSPATVLLVEDEPADRAPVARMLEIRGYRVLEAENVLTAMAIAERHRGPIHALLTNVILPDLSGRELAERLSLLRPEIGEIYMSGYADEEVLFFGLLGPDLSTLQKPVRPRDLFETLDRILEVEYA